MFVDVAESHEIIHGSNIFNRREVDLVCQTIQTLLPRLKANLSP